MQCTCTIKVKTLVNILTNIQWWLQFRLVVLVEFNKLLHTLLSSRTLTPANSRTETSANTGTQTI